MRARSKTERKIPSIILDPNASKPTSEGPPNGKEIKEKMRLIRKQIEEDLKDRAEARDFYQAIRVRLIDELRARML